jgi:hypothetical protein
VAHDPRLDRERLALLRQVRGTRVADLVTELLKEPVYLAGWD